MFVRTTRPLGFQVGHQHIVIRPSLAPVQVPDEVRNAAGFDLCVKHGDLVVIDSQEPATSTDATTEQSTEAPKAETKAAGRKPKPATSTDATTEQEV